MSNYQELFPKLFQDYFPPEGTLRMKFELGTIFPQHLIGLVKMVAFIEDQCIAIRQPTGWWEPGGKLESGETYRDAIQREMLEETGTKVKNFTLFGAFHCFSLTEKPIKPELLWPEFYFLWGYGEVEQVGQPHPTSTEKILEVAIAPIEDICKQFEQTPGAGPLLIDIYRMADMMRKAKNA